MDLYLRQDGHDGGSDAEEHVDADEDLVFSATIRVGVVDVEHDQRYQREQIVHCGDRQQGCEHMNKHYLTVIRHSDWTFYLYARVYSIIIIV